MLTEFLHIRTVSQFFHIVISSAILWFSHTMGNFSHLFYFMIRKQTFKTGR